MDRLIKYIKGIYDEKLDNDEIEGLMKCSIKTLNRRFKLKYKYSIVNYHKNFVEEHMIKTAKLEGKSVKEYFEETIEKNIFTYWSNYKSFNRFINKKKQ